MSYGSRPCDRPPTLPTRGQTSRKAGQPLDSLRVVDEEGGAQPLHSLKGFGATGFSHRTKQPTFSGMHVPSLEQTPQLHAGGRRSRGETNSAPRKGRLGLVRAPPSSTQSASGHRTVAFLPCPNLKVQGAKPPLVAANAVSENKSSPEARTAQAVRYAPVRLLRRRWR